MANPAQSDVKKLRLVITGAVQGVGFRPFVYRLARELELPGWVLNDGQGVFIEVEGRRAELELFCRRILSEAPPRALIQSAEQSWGMPEGHEEFSIRHSAESESPTVVVLPDIAVCEDCLEDLRDRKNRRFRYPFTNCTNCGPRFSIVERLPYDRPNTTMRRFELCEDCRREYENPRDRRFHAQPNACPDCGPQLALVDRAGSVSARGHRALVKAISALGEGAIVALKGIGGFLLVLDAGDGETVARLRGRKGRDEKPLAVMVASLGEARRLARLTPLEETLLRSPEAPIVVVERRLSAPLSRDVAPGNPSVGIMLACSPLHLLVSNGHGKPLVATSGNRSDEPIAIDNEEALTRLGEIADLFLWHDRPIARHVDDSVVKVVAGVPMFLRRARGFAPLPVRLPRPLPTLLAVGGHLKNVAAMSLGENVFLSQHIGDMESLEAAEAFDRVVADFLELYRAEPKGLVRDLHPDYVTSQWAERVSAGAHASIGRWMSALEGLPVVSVQHHHAHLASCLADSGHDGGALGVAWDGTGMGTDGTIWGGEFLVGDAASFRRVAALRPFALPGGERAVREPRRSALGAAWEVWGREALSGKNAPVAERFGAHELGPLTKMLATGFGVTLTTSAGRLFDAVASIVGLRQEVAFEGQAAMMLEFAATRSERRAYPLPLAGPAHREPAAVDSPELELDWRPLVAAIAEDSRRGTEVGIISARFHNALAAGVVAVAQAAGESAVALTGGCFQNRLLSELVSEGLEEAGFNVLRHRQVPANDGGLSLGQIVAAAARMEGGPG